MHDKDSCLGFIPISGKLGLLGLSENSQVPRSKPEYRWNAVLAVPVSEALRKVYGGFRVDWYRRIVDIEKGSARFLRAGSALTYDNQSLPEFMEGKLQAFRVKALRLIIQ